MCMIEIYSVTHIMIEILYWPCLTKIKSIILRVSDSYGLTGKVQFVNPAWGVEVFDPFVPRVIASHYIAVGTLGVLKIQNGVFNLWNGLWKKERKKEKQNGAFSQNLNKKKKFKS